MEKSTVTASSNWKENLTIEQSKTLSRKELSDWLQWCDPNGIWCDKYSKIEGLPNVTRSYALKMVAEFLNPNF